jgi:hypothetical protein
MVTPTAALNMLGEDTASELLERSFDLLTVSQRRFLVARIENTTDTAALKQAHVMHSSLDHWRSTSVAFEKVYLAAKRSTPAEIATISQMRFGYIAGTCLTAIEDFLAVEIDPDEVASGVYNARQVRANFALNVIKELRTRGAQAARERVNVKESSIKPGSINILELTQEAMSENGKDAD